MRNILKKITTLFTAGALLATSAAALAACGTNFKHPEGIPSGKAQSNGGFVVEVDNYYYFINGVETFEADNTYGAPVKGSLMRISKESVAKNENTAEIVIPSLMVAADHDSGIYIYGDRVYYATPNNVKSTSGEIERDFLDFKSAKLDGSDIQSYFYVKDNATTYRYVEVDETVYVLYYEGSEIISYNTSTKQATTLVKGVKNQPVFNKNEKEDPYVYYTMGVTMDIDVPGGSSDRLYDQVYRVRADWTASPYEALNNYEWNEDYLEENKDEAPYHNYGELVLDGIGSMFKDYPTIFSHDVEGVAAEDYTTVAGFTYTLQSYENGGLYFKRADVTRTSTVGEDGWLYYISADKFGEGWNSITGNAKENIDYVAQPTDAGKANDNALFYIEKDEEGNNLHRYLYVNGSNLFRAEVDKESGVADVTRIGQGIGSATLVSIDDSHDDYKYVYYTVSGTSGNKIFRTVYDGDAEKYKSLGYDENYSPVQILNIEHARSWYDYEIIGNLLFFADAETTGVSYNYIAYVNLGNEDGSLKNNVEMRAYNEALDATVGDEGYLADLTTDGRVTLSTAIKYYFFTGETQQFYDNIQEEIDKTGNDDLYAAEDVEAFKKYTEEEQHDLRSDYIHEIGKKSEEDQEAINEYWRTALEHYSEPVEEVVESKLPAWAGALIGIGVGLVVVCAGVAIWLVLRTRSREEGPKEEKMFVDTTDDRDVDVYADEPVEPVAEATEEAPTEEAPVEEAPVEEAPAEEVPEAPVEEPAQEPTEEPGEPKAE